MPAYRQGRVHVLDEKCSTCVFRGGNLMNLNSGRLKEMISSAIQDDSAIICHQTLEFNSSYESEEAVCRGFYDSHSQDSASLSLADHMEMIEFDEQPRSTKDDDNNDI